MTDAYTNFVMDLAWNAPPFQPTVTYNPDGGYIELLVKPDSFYAEHTSKGAIYRSFETDEVVGGLVAGCSDSDAEFLKELHKLEKDLEALGVDMTARYRLSAPLGDFPGADRLPPEGTMRMT